jgi:hypothetical protein
MNPEWGAEVTRLARANAKAADGFNGLTKRSRTHCGRGHEFAVHEAYNEIEYPKTRSLDAKLSADSRMTLLDRVSAEAGSDWWDIGMAISSGRQIR